MKRKNDENKRKTISITIDRELFNLIDSKTINRSRYINWLMLKKLKELGLDVSKIKL